MKLFGIHGDFFHEGASFPTQEIEFNSTPGLELATPKVTRDILSLGAHVLRRDTVSVWRLCDEVSHRACNRHAEEAPRRSN